MKKKYLIFAFLIVLLILKAGTVYAFEVKYPVIIGLPNINQDGTTLAKFVEYFFGLGVYVVGVIGTIAFAIGAVEFIVSGGNASTASEAKDRMKSAILGVVIAVLAGLILSMINGNIAKFNFLPLPTTSPTQAFEQPGVYFCSGGCDGTKCQGAMSGVMTSDQDPISVPIKGVRIVEDLASKINYGVILHSDSLDSTGACSLPIYDKSSSPAAVTCETISASMNVSAANIFTIGNKSAGNGVNFYSDVNGWGSTIFSGEKILATAGICHIDKININPVFIGKAASMNYQYSSSYGGGCTKVENYNSNVSQEKQDVAKTVQNGFGSIEIGSNGGYLVVIYSGASSSAISGSGSAADTYCRTITTDVGDAGPLGIAGPNGSQLGSIYIFSTR